MMMVPMKKTLGCPNRSPSRAPKKHRAAHDQQVDDDNPGGVAHRVAEIPRNAGQGESHGQGGKLHQQLSAGHGRKHLAALRRIDHSLVVGDYSGHEAVSLQGEVGPNLTFPPHQNQLYGYTVSTVILVILGIDVVSDKIL